MVEITWRCVSYSDSECSYLDLNVVEILGFEKRKHCSDVEKIIRGIENKVDFPPVFLVPVGKPDELKYRLTLLHDYVRRSNFGGHRRAIAHYIENKPMKCLILKPDLVKSNDPVYELVYFLFPIKDIILY